MDEMVLDESQAGPVQHFGGWGRLVLKLNLWRASWQQRSVGQRSLIISLAVVVISITIIGLIVLGWGSSEDKVTGQLSDSNDVKVDLVSPAEPKDQVSPLTGEFVTATQYREQLTRLPLAVVIENHPDARPQTGLDQADLVYETLAEGGITRFVAVYWSKQPEVVGPVRSVRRYFLDLIGGLGDPLLMHIGGATSDNPQADALRTIQTLGVKSLGSAANGFWRVSDRAAPHNAYSSTKQLWQTASEWGWVGPVSVTPWSYKDAQLPVDNVSVSKIQLNWNGWGENDWSVVWQFDPVQNLYDRFHLMDPHIDAISKKQLTARNIIVIFAPEALANDGTARIVFDLIGKGPVTIFRDGRVITGEWSKLGRTDQVTFSDDQGEEVVLNRGVSWVMVVPTNSPLTY